MKIQNQHRNSMIVKNLQIQKIIKIRLNRNQIINIREMKHSGLIFNKWQMKVIIYYLLIMLDPETMRNSRI